MYKKLIVLFLFLASCSSSSKDEMTGFEGRAMTMTWEVKIGEKLPHADKALVEKAISQSFHTIDTIYNNWNPNSEISRINQLAAGQKIEISKELADFLQHTGTLVAFTEGRFDPTIEPLQKLYKSSFSEGHWPSSHIVTELREAIGWDKVHIEGRMFWKDHDKTALDLSGVAKGYAVDLITETLQTLGYQNLYVEWGGEIRTAGTHKTGAPWRIAIMGSEIIEMHDESVATSGNYYQRWQVGDKIYTHIIDPDTHLPLEVSEHRIPSAAVKSQSCRDADALATALMIFPSRSQAEEWISHKGLFAWIIE